MSPPDVARSSVADPVEEVDTRSAHKVPEPGTALCLSGGGYRAMLFHLGTLWQLYEAGLLKDMKRISSVSGGSITSAVLGMQWTSLRFDPAMVREDFVPKVVGPVRRLAGKTIDAGSILEGVLLPGTISDKIARSYRKYLYGKWAFRPPLTGEVACAGRHRDRGCAKDRLKKQLTSRCEYAGLKTKGHVDRSHFRSHGECVNRKVGKMSTRSFGRFAVVLCVGLLSATITQEARSQSQSEPPDNTATWVASVPSGAISFTFSIWDDDLFSDDKLFGPSDTIVLGGEEEVVINYEYDCASGQPSGPCGSSGESTAELYAEITWTFPDPAPPQTSDTDVSSESCN